MAPSMGINAALTIIAIVSVIALLIIAVAAGVVIRTFLRLERVLARTEQEMAPLLFDLKVLLGELQKIVRSGGKQMERVEATLRYVDRELRDTIETFTVPVQEFGIWARAVRAGWRYFARRR
ncbi:DUF948 domain-containing protein [Candidatus Igneacidithiobacillus taiwanensis]|uniref:DUF948 domain-containing protein n=2 Tax=Candidatus Igneacidithiobacillus taiwanensis TaxID=1945924 RepID=UPI002897F575|nr:DUF948 domain-containing protein [Candidatus Igneacidithiobacillus taiwanensis]